MANGAGAADYAGEIEPSEAYRRLGEREDAVLIDVRTDAEWAYVGVPDLEAVPGTMVTRSWQIFPTMHVDPGFAADLDATLQAMGRGPDAPLLFLCRSGVRSLAAARAMTAVGYSAAYNITKGFEGDPDAKRHRGGVNGWKADGLPWMQG